MTTKNIFETSDATFEQDALKTDQLVIVDFWAAWCGPCRLLAPHLEKLAERYQTQLKIFKLDVDVNPNTAIKFQVKGIPTLLFFKAGAIVHQTVGMQSLESLIGAVDKILMR